MKCEYCFNHQATYAYSTETNLSDICIICKIYLEAEIAELGFETSYFEFYELK